MKYSKGVKGPQTTHDMEILGISRHDNEKRLTQIVASVQLKKGVRHVRLLLQGKHHDALTRYISIGQEFRAEIRWTGYDAATVTKVIAILEADIVQAA